MGKAGKIGGELDAGSWSEWRTIDGLPPLLPSVLAEILDGGQAFRWYRVGPDTWIGAWSDCIARIRLGRNSMVEWSAPEPLTRRVESALARYLALEVDFTAVTDALPWRSDAHLGQCIEAFRVLRILRQPFGETLLGFLCSATKQIIQIKQMLALLARRHGERICTLSLTRAPELAAAAAIGGSDIATNANVLQVHALPTWSKLATIPELELRGCLLGFRAKYIAETARLLAAHPGWLEETETLPYADAKERLCSLPGVGEKVADCVLLFGAGRLEAFPVDVWILKTLAKRYGLNDWKPAPLAQFGRVHFGQYAGLAQQYLFAWERRIGRNGTDK